MNERDIQILVHQFLSNPSQTFQTLDGSRLQILSPGKINYVAGPDFSDIAILLNGNIFVGDAEFHRKTSEWNIHHHDDNSLYDNVILHIVFQNDINHYDKHNLLILNQNEVFNIKNDPIKEDENIATKLEDLQQYALIRMLRKSMENQKLLKQFDLQMCMQKSLESFLERYNSRRHRPVYSKEQLLDLHLSISNSRSFDFLKKIKDEENFSIQDSLQTILKNKIDKEGSGLRREILLNCVLPLAMCLANEETRIKLFFWYWSTPALGFYSILKRRFPDIPQNFLWQQQGMLEYIKEMGQKKGLVTEAFTDYGFAEVLGFYKMGKSPFKDIEIN